MIRWFKRPSVLSTSVFQAMPASVQIPFSYTRYDRWDELPAADRELLEAARSIAAKAYAAYSDFQVGAALRMVSGLMVTGNNQENASYPAGICAERTALHAAMSQDPDGVVSAMAVVVPSINGDTPVSPCGICRQALLEQEGRQSKQPLRLLLGVVGGPVFEIATASHLLPIHFDKSMLKPKR